MRVLAALLLAVSSAALGAHAHSKVLPPVSSLISYNRLVKPDDPTRVLDKAERKWVKLPTSKVSPYLVRAGAYMYKTSARAQVFVAGRWVPTVQAMADGYIDEAYRRCPLMHYNKKTKRWAATSRPPIRNWVVMRKGGWWFLSKRMLSKVFVDGRWVSFKRVAGSDPRWYRSKGKWRFRVGPVPYVRRNGYWWRGQFSFHAYENFRWINVLNDPRWTAVGRGRGRWARVPFKRGEKPLWHLGSDGFWHRTKGSPLVFVGRKWVNKASYVAAVRGRRQLSALRRSGALTADMRASVHAQVEARFAEFTKWFVRDYLHGGNLTTALSPMEARMHGITSRKDPWSMAHDNPNHLGELVVNGAGSGVPKALRAAIRGGNARISALTPGKRFGTGWAIDDPKTSSAGQAALETTAEEGEERSSLGAQSAAAAAVDGAESADAPPPNLPVTATADPSLDAPPEVNRIVVSSDPTTANAPA